VRLLRLGEASCIRGAGGAFYTWIVESACMRRARSYADAHELRVANERPTTALYVLTCAFPASRSGIASRNASSFQMPSQAPEP
jgi:hypothetical protein